MNGKRLRANKTPQKLAEYSSPIVGCKKRQIKMGCKSAKKPSISDI
jgi:hypothetical protein